MRVLFRLLYLCISSLERLNDLRDLVRQHANRRSKHRRTARDFAERVYAGIRFNRIYALTGDAKVMLAALACSMAERHCMNSHKDDDLYAEKPFAWLINQLSLAGCNILQNRPTDKKPLPELWTNAITGQQLSPPASPDKRFILAKTGFQGTTAARHSAACRRVKLKA